MSYADVDKHLYPLKGVVQHYDWGGNELIPTVTGHQPDGKPMAEYWLGAHHSAPSVVKAGKDEKLDALIESNPSKYLGKTVSDRFHRLPFLLKLLDVKKMLSIQVHPSKETAKENFARENSEGISISSAARNYKDENHKPELMVALDDFWLLHGFKPAVEMISGLTNVPELGFLKEDFHGSDYSRLYSHIMLMDQEEVNSILQPLLDRIIPVYKNGKLEKSSADFWAARAALSFNQGKNIDRGIFSIYLFNLVNLKKGEAIFQDAGVPHAYLEGKNVEIMANSDNVLRGGLTPKHVDVNELLRNVKCEETVPVVIKGGIRGREKVYVTPAGDFELSVMEMRANENVHINIITTSIFLLIDGAVTVKAGGTSLKLERGNPSAIAFPETEIDVSCIDNAVVYRASVPIHNA